MPRTIRRSPLFILSFAVVAAGAGTPGNAQQLEPALQTCTTLDCGSLFLPGRINGHPAAPPVANQWVTQIAGRAPGCMRFEVTAQTADLALSVVAPDGTVFSNDNGSAPSCSSCPLVVVGTARNGYYTVVAGAVSGLSTEAQFALRAGLYNTGNSPNCSNPTPPR